MLLSDLYSRDNDSLLEDMRNASTVLHIFEAVDAYLTKVTDLKGEYVSSLTGSQARLALSILGVNKEYFRRVADYIDHLSQSLLERPNQISLHHAPARHSNSIFAKETLAGIGASTCVAAFLTNPLVAIPAASIAGLLAATALQSTSHSPSSSSQSEDHRQSRTPPQYDYDTLLSTLGQLFKTVDDVLEQFNTLMEAAQPQPLVPRLEDHERLLELLQDLLGWYRRKKDELPEVIADALESRLGEQLPDLLSEYRIEIANYLTEGKQRDARLFEFDEEVGKPRLTEPLMVRPALLKEGNVLLRGRVIKPSSENSDIKRH